MDGHYAAIRDDRRERRIARYGISRVCIKKSRPGENSRQSATRKLSTRETFSGTYYLLKVPEMKAGDKFKSRTDLFGRCARSCIVYYLFWNWRWNVLFLGNVCKGCSISTYILFLFSRVFVFLVDWIIRCCTWEEIYHLGHWTFAKLIPAVLRELVNTIVHVLLCLRSNIDQRYTKTLTSTPRCIASSSTNCRLGKSRFAYGQHKTLSKQDVVFRDVYDTIERFM